MNPFDSVLIGALQGATELFPVSSLGHAVVIPSLFHWNVQITSPSFVPFLVLLHLATATALLILYRQTWAQIVVGFGRAAIRGQIKTENERLAMMLLVGTIPAGIMGVIFEHPLKSLFATPRLVAIFLLVNALILFAAEVFRRIDERRMVQQESNYLSIDGLSFKKVLLIGSAQAFALFPGISRSGITLATGLVSGLRHQEAVKLSFLLATPIIGAAGLLEIPQLFSASVPIGTYLLGAVVAGVVAYLSAKLLVRYFQVGRLDPFAIYCGVLGIVALIFIR